MQSWELLTFCLFLQKTCEYIAGSASFDKSTFMRLHIIIVHGAVMPDFSRNSRDESESEICATAI